MSLLGDNWNYRPVRFLDGSVYITEVYYTPSKDVCHIDTGIKIPYFEDLDKSLENLQLYYPLVKQMNKYDHNIIEYKDDDDLPGWKFNLPVSEK